MSKLFHREKITSGPPLVIEIILSSCLTKTVIILRSDKTGTLTQNKMTDVKTYLYNRKIELLETCSEETNQLLNYFTLCSDGDRKSVV